MESQGWSTVLIASDTQANRARLRQAFVGLYRVEEAADGHEALQKMRSMEIDVAILDLFVSQPDNYGMLAAMQADERLSQISVLVAVANGDEENQVRALDMGAVDLILAPFSLRIIQARVSNIMAQRENQRLVEEQEQLRQHIEHQKRKIMKSNYDSVTGLYNREVFCRAAAKLIAVKPEGYYVLCSFDVDNFKVVNDLYGPAMGDRVLQCIGETVRGFCDANNGISARKFADNFAMIFPDSVGMDFQKFIDSVNDLLSKEDGHIQVQLSAGCYHVTDKSHSVSAMLDLALLTKRTVKNRYDVHIACYTSEMRERMLQEQWIIGEMENALATGQFETWFQPQFDHATGELIGAEALVRWRHPSREGLLPPAVFIGVFERNGFIYELDKFVWESSCRHLRGWLDAGLHTPPVSVNVSRYDVFRPDFVDTIIGLMRRYRIPKELFRLEITESAFAQSAEQIVSTVQQLREQGLAVEIDDFGSGYSSFNTLKDVPADVLKIDMRFLQGNGHSDRGGNILESIVRMTRWMGMSVMAEGVETREQADFLLSIGCAAIQGYFYSKPLPVEEYEKVMQTAHVSVHDAEVENVNRMNHDAFWNPDSIDTLVFNRYAGGACVFEFDGSRIELLRINGKYASVFQTRLSEDALLRQGLQGMLDEACRNDMLAIIQRAVESKSEESFEARYDGRFEETGHEEFVRFTIRMIASTGCRQLFYGYVENSTAQRQAERQVKSANEQLQLIMDSVGSGVVVLNVDDDGFHFRYANNQFFVQRGLNREDMDIFQAIPTDCVHHDDKAQVIETLNHVKDSCGSSTCIYRIVKNDGGVLWLQDVITPVRFFDDDASALVLVTNDVTAIKEAERRLVSASDQLLLLSDIAHGLLTGTAYDVSMERTLEKIRAHFDCSRVSVSELDSAGVLVSRLYEVRAGGLAPEYEVAPKITPKNSDYWNNIYREQQCVCIPDVNQLDDQWKAERDSLKARHIRSLLSMPLRRDNRLIGFICMENPKKNAEEVDHLAALSDYITIILAKRDYEAELSSGGQTGIKQKGEGGMPAALNNLDSLPYLTATYAYENDTLRLIYENDYDKNTADSKGQGLYGSSIGSEERQTLVREIKAAIREKRDICCDIPRVDSDGHNVLMHVIGKVDEYEQKKAIAYLDFMPALEELTLLQEQVRTQRDTYAREYEELLRLKETLSVEKRRTDLFSMLFLGAAEGKYDIVTQVDLSTGKTMRLNYGAGACRIQPRLENWEAVCRNILRQTHPDDRGLVQSKLTLEALSAAANGTVTEFMYRRKADGHVFHWYSTRFRIFEGADGARSAIVLSTNINEDMEERSRLHDMAEHDGMTDLFNRAKLASMERGEYRDLTSCGVLFFDVNGLKTVNDHDGHNAGDLLLRMMADSIRSITSRRIHAYRFGGDEFLVVVCNGIEDELAMLIALWRERLEILKQTNGVSIEAAVGTAWRKAPLTLEELIREADRAMYADKKEQKRSSRRTTDNRLPKEVFPC